MSNLQIPDPSYAVSSRHHGVPRPVSVSVQPSPASASQSASRRQRASHQVVSSQQHQQESAADDQPPYRDVYAHPAAVNYAAAHPRRTIPKFGPYLLLQTLGEGEFGKVKLGLHHKWGEEVAVKLIRRGNIDTSVRMSKVEREIEVLRMLNQPCAVPQTPEHRPSLRCYRNGQVHWHHPGICFRWRAVRPHTGSSLPQGEGCRKAVLSTDLWRLVHPPKENRPSRPQTRKPSPRPPSKRYNYRLWFR
ncbi:hypothetical protein EDD15DRAFT_935257 [Pisolithus albus]|nr:hypothetical protein EDD15DRAFT_935257 [Pisolithus albus]